MFSDALFQTRQRARRRVRAGAAIAAAVVAAVIAAVIFIGHRGTPPEHTPAAAPAAPAGSVAPAPSRAMDDAEPTAAVPADITWAQDAGISVPVSAHAGPHDTSGGLARGFSHDPGGAVIAAVHLLVNTSPNVGPDVFDTTISNQVVGPDAATLQANAQSAYQQLITQSGLVYGQPAGGTTTVIRGYRVQSYSPNKASVQVLITTAENADTVDWIAISTTLSWWHGDWALNAPAGGVWNNAMVLQPASPAGFAQFLTAGGNHG